ncbi:MAG: DUF465 domain-containing protein [Gammaproteobacteria bacterium]|nr:DUF465 domain-containing protein [Gammaproteobacteria bacterium]
MFEFDQEVVDALLTDNDNFRRLYKKHASLKSRIDDANQRTNPMDEMALEKLKKEKLLLKDQMAALIREYRQDSR